MKVRTYGHGDTLYTCVGDADNLADGEAVRQWQVDMHGAPQELTGTTATVANRQLSTVEASPERPVYAKVLAEDTGTSLYMVTVDEGWRKSILCTGMYEWAADWLVDQLQGKPYAPGERG